MVLKVDHELVITEVSAEKIAHALKDRSKRVAIALANVKKTDNEQKKTSKAMMRDQEKIHAKEMKSAVEEGLSQCKSVKCRLESEHKRDVTTLVIEHDNSVTKINI